MKDAGNVTANSTEPPNAQHSHHQGTALPQLMGPLGGQTISLDVSHVKDDALNQALQYCGGRLSRQESIFVPFTFSIVILLRTIYLLLTLCHTLGYMLCRVIIFSIHKKDYEADTTIIPILWRGRQRCGT